MAKTPSFGANRESDLRILFNELTKVVREWIGEKNTSRHEKALRSDVFIPVANFTV
jgi:hypothetical protein